MSESEIFKSKPKIKWSIERDDNYQENYNNKLNNLQGKIYADVNQKKENNLESEIRCNQSLCIMVVS